MRRILVTGMSGTGKSSVVRELRARGHDAVDTDDGWCEPTSEGRQRWREDAIGELLDAEPGPGGLFVAGCEENQARFHDRFDVIVLLSLPHDVLLSRVASRTTNPFGKDPAERERVLADLDEIEPLLRAAADVELRTTAPLAEVVDALVELASVPGASER